MSLFILGKLCTMIKMEKKNKTYYKIKMLKPFVKTDQNRVPPP